MQGSRSVNFCRRHFQHNDLYLGYGDWLDYMLFYQENSENLLENGLENTILYLFLFTQPQKSNREFFKTLIFEQTFIPLYKLYVVWKWSFGKNFLDGFWCMFSKETSKTENNFFKLNFKYFKNLLNPLNLWTMPWQLICRR